MKPRLPLFVKIVAWFVLNLVLLAVAGWIVLRVQLRAGFDSFLAGHAGQRVEPIARGVLQELAALPRDEWEGALRSAGEAHGLQFGLFIVEGQQVIGPVGDVPEVIRGRLPHPPQRRDGAKGPPFGKKRPSADEGRRPLPDDGTQESPPTEHAKPAGAPPPGPGAVHNQFLVRTADPEVYWLGLFMAVRTPMRGMQPAVFLARSETFTAGGLFFDFKPWLMAAGGVVLLSALFWLPFVHGITRSVSQMTTATAQIAEGRFEVRVDARRRDELGQLGGGINALGERLEGFVTGQKRFLGDIAHELCSPLARLQMSIGILEQRADARQQPCIEDLREEVQHMSDLVNELLSFSKASLKPGEVHLRPVQVAAIVAAAVKREAAGERDVRLSVPQDLRAVANADLLQRAVSNLLRNALRYAGHAGPVTLAARRVDASVAIVIADHGPGIADKHLPRIFDTFYRIEPDRARETGGVGLGLAIVKACVEACNGTVRARNRRRGGLKVTLLLPRALSSDIREPGAAFVPGRADAGQLPSKAAQPAHDA